MVVSYSIIWTYCDSFNHFSVIRHNQRHQHICLVMLPQFNYWCFFFCSCPLQSVIIKQINLFLSNGSQVQLSSHRQTKLQNHWLAYGALYHIAPATFGTLFLHCTSGTALHPLFHGCSLLTLLPPFLSSLHPSLSSVVKLLEVRTTSVLFIFKVPSIKNYASEKYLLND